MHVQMKENGCTRYFHTQHWVNFEDLAEKEQTRELKLALERRHATTAKT